MNTSISFCLCERWVRDSKMYTKMGTGEHNSNTSIFVTIFAPQRCGIYKVYILQRKKMNKKWQKYICDDVGHLTSDLRLSYLQCVVEEKEKWITESVRGHFPQSQNQKSTEKTHEEKWITFSKCNLNNNNKKNVGAFEALEIFVKFSGVRHFQSYHRFFAFWTSLSLDDDWIFCMFCVFPSVNFSSRVGESEFVRRIKGIHIKPSPSAQMYISDWLFNTIDMIMQSNEWPNDKRNSSRTLV